MKKRRIVLNIVIFILFLGQAYSEIAQSQCRVVIQRGGKLLTLDEALTTLPIKSTNEKYVLSKSLNQACIGTENNGKMEKMINALFPTNVKVDLNFRSVRSNSEIFFDGSFQIRTDLSGNAEITHFYPEPGRHTIQLKKDNIFTNEDTVRISSKSVISCTGKQRMFCSVSPYIYSKSQNNRVLLSNGLHK